MAAYARLEGAQEPSILVGIDSYCWVFRGRMPIFFWGRLLFWGVSGKGMMYSSNDWSVSQQGPDGQRKTTGRLFLIHFRGSRF